MSSPKKKNLKVALVHDYLNQFGGAERVLWALHEIWPEAEIFTLFCKKGSPAQKAFESAKIKESWFGKIPSCEKLVSPLRFLLPVLWRSFDFSDFDIVLSSASWAITKGFKKEGMNRPVEICYCHTPPRYLYGYETSRNWEKNFLLRVYGKVVNHFLRMEDFERAQRVDLFVANSQEVKKRIAKFYRREAVVINPPVDLPKKIGVSQKGDWFLTGGRLERAKNFELIIEACKRLGRKLKIYGSGSQEKSLERLGEGKVEFLGRVTDEERERLMAGCRAFIVAATDEDFGITPVEAMAVGRPVIAFRGGGYLESVIEGKTGVFFNEPTAESLMVAIEEFEEKEKRGIFKEEACIEQARKFSKENFKKRIKKLVEEYARIT